MARSQWILAICFATLLSACDAWERCRERFCRHGCCDYDNNQCCEKENDDNARRLGAFMGIFVGGGALSFCMIIILCFVCRRRRRNNDSLYPRRRRGQVIGQQELGTSNLGYVAGALEPGLACPPYEAQDPLSGSMLPPYSPTADGQPPPPPPATVVVAPGPPSYESLFQSGQQQQQIPSVSERVSFQPGYTEAQKSETQSGHEDLALK